MPGAAASAPTGWRLWLAGMRPRTLWLSVAPVLVGVFLALSHGRGGPLWVPPLILAAALAIQAGTNLWNDAADGGDDRRARVGPPRLVASGWADEARVRRAALACFAVAGLAGMALAWRGGWPILALGAASLLAGWGYSCGPRPLSHTPLGEIFVLAFFGIGAVAGTYWLMALALHGDALVLGIAMGLPAAAVLMVNNIRDAHADTLAGRRTLAIILGPRRARLAYGVLLLLPFAVTAPLGLGWIGWAALPWGVVLAWRMARLPDEALNPLLGGTTEYSVVLALTLAAALP